MNRHHVFLNNLYIVIGYFILFLFLTFPLILQFTSLIIGGMNRMPDLNGTLWLYRLARDSFVNLNFKELFHTDIIFYPFGKNVLLEMGNIFQPIMSIPLQLIFGFPAYHNLICLIILTLNGFSMYLLINYFIKSFPVSLLTSIIFALNPFVISQINYGALDEANAFWMLLYILYLFKMMDTKKLKYSLLAALFFSITSLSYSYYGLFSIFFTIIVFTNYLFLNRDVVFDLSSLKGISILFFIPVIILFPVFRIYCKNLYLLKGTPWLSNFPPISDFAAQKLPLYYNHIIDFSSKVPPLFKAETYINNFFYLKFILILIAFFTAFRKHALLWVTVAIFFYILSLGPYLQYAPLESVPPLKGKPIFPGIPLAPYLFFYKYVPFFSRLRWLDRLLIMGSVSLTIIYSFSFNWVFKKHRVFGLAFLSLSTFLLISGDLPQGERIFQLERIYVSEFYRALREEKDCAIIEMPMTYTMQKNLYYQTVHNKKTLGGMGMGERNEFLLPDRWLDFIKNNSFLGFLWELPNRSGRKFEKEDVDILKKLGYKYIVVNPEYFIKSEKLDLNWDAYYKTKEILLELCGRVKDYPDNISVYMLSDI